MNRVAAGILAVVALAAASNGRALTSVGNFGVSTTLLRTCSVTATPLNFGNYIAGAGALTVNSTVNIRCTRSTAFTVALNSGTTAGGTISQRLLTNGTSTLQYNLFRTAAAITVFGDGTAGSRTRSGVGSGLASTVRFTVFGNLPDSASNRVATPGGYTDTVGVTVTY